MRVLDPLNRRKRMSTSERHSFPGDSRTCVAPGLAVARSERTNRFLHRDERATARFSASARQKSFNKEGSNNGDCSLRRRRRLFWGLFDVR